MATMPMEVASAEQVKKTRGEGEEEFHLLSVPEIEDKSGQGQKQLKQSSYELK